MIRKLKVILLTVVLIFFIGTYCASTARAADKVSGDFKYKVTGDTVTITKYIGEKRDVTVPSKINGKTVTKIGYRAFEHHEDYWIERIKFPKGIIEIDKYAFFGSNIKSITIPGKVKRISAYAFAECQDLEEVILPEKLLYIDAYAFYYCRNLKRIDFPSSLIQIGESAFEACEDLKSIIIPNSVSKLGINIFNRCKKINQVSLPSNLKYIPGGLFFGCSRLVEITIPDTVEKIGSAAFASTNLSKINIPSKVTEINDRVFDGCIKLKDIKLPDKITRIGKEAFRGCTLLTNVQIPQGVTLIGASAFEGCSGIKKITIPEGITKFNDYLFKDCKNLTQITISQKLTNLGKGTFQGCINLKEVAIPDGIKTIDEYTFDQCTGLLSITIPDSVTKIGKMAFSNCSKLKDVKLSNNLKTLDKGAFYNCSSLQRITLPDSLELLSVYKVEDQPFGRCTALTKIQIGENNNVYETQNGILYNKGKTMLIYCPPAWEGEYIIPDTVTTILPAAFAYQSKLESIIIPDTVTDICSEAFIWAKSVKNITLPKNIKEINSNTFSGSGVISLTIPEGVTDLSWSAFDSCEALKELYLPKSLKGEYEMLQRYGEFSGRFEGCTMLEKIEVAEGNKYYIDIEGVLYYKEYNKKDKITYKKLLYYPPGKKDTTYTLPENTTIEIHAFNNCKNLRKVIMPEGFKYFENYFYQCENIDVYMPRSISNFIDEAHIPDFPFFGDCKNCYVVAYKDSKVYKYCKKFDIPCKIRKS